MRNGFFRIVREVHAWLGATLALLVLLVSVTGALLIWKRDYLQLDIREDFPEGGL